MSIYGNPKAHIVDDRTDFIGIRTLVMTQLWQPSRSGMSQAEIDAETPPVPPTPGGVILIGEQTRLNQGALHTTWTFEGIRGDGKGVTFKDRVHSLDFGFEPGFAEVDLRQHPNLEVLLKKYGGWPDADGNIVWPRTYGSGGGTSLGFNGGAAKEVRSPLFGVQSFLRMEGSYSHRYASLAKPRLNGLGFIATSLPGDPPIVGDGRSWLFAAAPYRRRGLIYDVKELYWLSGPGGWPKPLYERPAGEPGGSLPGLGEEFTSGKFRVGSEFGPSINYPAIDFSTPTAPGSFPR